MRPLGPVLDEILVPGSNRKGDLPGANWRFVLPELALGRVLVIGTPSARTLSTLRGSASEVVVLGRADGRRRYEPEGAVDLLVVLGVWELAGLLRNRRRVREVRRVLRDEAPVVLEGHFLSALRAPERLAGRLGGRVAVNHVGTPQGGELQTLVPADQSAVLAWFADHGLLRPSLARHDLSRAWARLRRGRSRRSPDAAGSGPPGPSAVRAAPAGSVRGAIGRAVDVLARAERALDAAVPVGRREVVLLSAGRVPVRAHPPAYVARLAAARGIDLSDFGYGLAAGAEYESQKVLIPLFPPGSSAPAYLVKLTRSERYSSRLERAADALEALATLGLADGRSTPTVVFRGREAGLSVVAETAIDGEGFRSAVDWQRDGHPLAREAVCWFTTLGVQSRVRHPGDDGGPAGTLRSLLDRYVELYRPAPDTTSFLAERLAVGEPSIHALPLVLQHGDPGPQNLIVSRDGGLGVFDWENADPLGLPLADVIYLLWTYGVMEGAARGIRDPFEAGIGHVLDGSDLSPLISTSIREYSIALGLDRQVLEPLFYGSWLYQALKEATRLPPGALERGVYTRLLAACAAHPDAPGLRSFFTRTSATPATPE